MDPTTLEQLDARLARIEARLSTLTDLVEQVAPNIAIATDVADEWVETHIGGDQAEARVASIEAAALQLTEPKTLNALTRVAALAPKLELAASLAGDLEDNIAIATDVADEWIAERVGSNGMNERVTAGLDALLALSDPRVLASLTRLATQAPDLAPFAELGIRLAPSLERVSSEAVAPVGAFGLMGALSDPQVQQGLGVVLQLTRALGQSAQSLPAKS
jgi:uncharacterized protein YjgD (DUF1641 family)